LRVGVIGLGAHWRRYRRALLACRNRFTICVVADEIHQRADLEARRLGCEAAEGPTDLLQTRGLDAALLLERGWYGLWPLEQAARLKKPVFCVPSLAADLENAGRVLEALSQPGVRVMFALPWRCTPATIRLRRLLQSRLGPAKRIVCHLTSVCGAGSEWAVDWCLHLLEQQPAQVQRIASAGLTSMLLDFAGGCCVHLSLASLTPGGATSQPKMRAEIYAEHGIAEVNQPNRLTWRRGPMTTRELLRPERTVEERMLLRFRQMVLGARSDAPGVDAARAVHAILNP
jgi:predicted dehydrogenase